MKEPNRASNPDSMNQRKQIPKAISSAVDVPPVSRGYVLGLLATAGAITLLTMLYFAVIALVIGFVAYFIQNSETILIGFPPFAKLTMLVVVTGCGTAFVFGLLKPFLARTVSIARPRTLIRETEPLLFEFVDRLCDALGAVRPDEICVTSDVNAAAELQSDWRSPLSPQKISLHLGLPLVGGLTLPQFTGILAHELGHFTQRTAMRLENCVRRTNRWLRKSATENDAVDEWLIRHCRSRGPMAVLCYVVRGVIWITRQFLLGLACAANVISCLMSREMELNADRCEVRTVGARVFASTLWRIRQLTVAHQLSFRDVAAFYDEGRLPDNMIALAVSNTSFVTAKIQQKLRRMMLEERTGPFDAYPADRDRILAATTDGSPGVFRLGSLPRDLPASVLFRDFEDVSKAETVRYFENVLNRPIKAKMLHPVGKLLERQNLEIESAKALRRYFQTDVPALRPLPIAAQSTDYPDDWNEVIDELKACRERMTAELPNYQRLSPRYITAEECLFETIAAQSLLQARLELKPDESHLKDASPDYVADKLARSRDAVATLAGKLLQFETEAGHRLSFALQLFQIPDIVQRLPQGDDLQYEVQSLLPEAQFVSRLINELPSLRIIYYRLMTLKDRIPGDKSKRRVMEALQSQLSTLHLRLTGMHSEMGDRLYPFEHAQANATLQQYALPVIPGEHDLGGLVQVTEQLQSRLRTLQIRLFARLAQAAELMEAAIGMPPLPEPEIDDAPSVGQL